MSRRYVAPLLGIGCVLWSGLVYAKQPTIEVSYADIGKSIQITGHFGQPLGKVVTIKGELIDVNDPRYLNVKYWPYDCEEFLVSHFEGKELSQPFVIPIHFIRNRPIRGTPIVLRGHERAAFAGSAPEINALLAKMGYSPNPWRFDVWLQVDALLEVDL